jgi:hexosaminidase
MHTRRLLVLLIVGCLLVCTIRLVAEEAHCSIIPMPQSFQSRTGHFLLNRSTCIRYNEPKAQPVARMLALYLRPATGFALPVSQGASQANSVSLTLDPQLKDLGSEGYELIVGKESVCIKAFQPAGLFYAIQSLRQLLPPALVSTHVLAEQPWHIPACTIKDRPRFAWRAFLLDEARHFKGMAVVKQVLDQMAGLKMNVFHWHLTDDQGWRIEIKQYPRLTEVGSKRNDTQVGGWNSPKRSGKPHEGFYTQAQIKEIVQYAKDRHITIMPEIEMPGHASAACSAYPELGTSHGPIEVPVVFGKLASCYNAADENVYRMLSAILDEVVSLFDSPVIHIGGDEVRFDHWKQSEQIKTLMQREGLKTLADVQIHFTNRMSWIIQNKQRRMMGWNDIMGDDLHGFLKDGQVAQAAALANDTIVHFWKGSPELAKKAIDRGHEVVNSWHVYTYLDYNYQSIPLKKAYDFDPMFAGLSQEQQSKVLGLGCQMWGEWIPSVADMERQVYPRIAAYAEVGWTETAHKDYAGFQQRIKHQYERWDRTGIQYTRGQ